MYLTRDLQAQYIRSKGIPCKAQMLADLQSQSRGPRIVKINGRALSTKEWLDEWIAAQAAQPVVRRKCQP
jgi:hypothetical protein